MSLEYAETLGLHFSCNPALLLNLAPYLGHVRNLYKLSLASIHEDNFISPEARRHLITGFTLQLLKLECLQKLQLGLRVCTTSMHHHLPAHSYS